MQTSGKCGGAFSDQFLASDPQCSMKFSGSLLECKIPGLKSECVLIGMELEESAHPYCTTPLKSIKVEAAAKYVSETVLLQQEMLMSVDK